MGAHPFCPAAEGVGDGCDARLRGLERVRGVSPPVRTAAESGGDGGDARLRGFDCIYPHMSHRSFRRAFPQEERETFRCPDASNKQFDSRAGGKVHPGEP